MGFLPGLFEQWLHIGFKIVNLQMAFQRLVLCVNQGTPGRMSVSLPHKCDLDFLWFFFLLERLYGMGTLFRCVIPLKRSSIMDFFVSFLWTICMHFALWSTFQFEVRSPILIKVGFLKYTLWTILLATLGSCWVGINRMLPFFLLLAQLLPMLLFTFFYFPSINFWIK